MISEIKKGKRTLTVQQVIGDFSKKGINLSEKEAEQYLDLLYFLAKLVVKNNFIS